MGIIYALDESQRNTQGQGHGHGRECSRDPPNAASRRADSVVVNGRARLSQQR